MTQQFLKCNLKDILFLTSAFYFVLPHANQGQERDQENPELVLSG